MKSIKVGEYIALVDNQDFELVSEHSWYFQHGYARTDIYKMGNRERLYMHRLIRPDLISIDHINRDGLDNRRANLRDAKDMNTVNQRPYNRLGLKGVYQSGKTFYIKLKKQGASINIGGFEDKYEAAHIYSEIAKQLWGEYAYTNEH